MIQCSFGGKKPFKSHYIGKNLKIWYCQSLVGVQNPWISYSLLMGVYVDSTTLEIKLAYSGKAEDADNL